MTHDFSKLKNRRNLVALVVCLVLLALLGHSLYGGSDSQKGKKQGGKPNATVETYQVKRGDMARHIVLTGQTVADATINIAPRYAGRVTDVNAQLGDKVKEGDILVVQDIGDLDISIRQSEAAAEASSADAITEEASYNANLIKTKTTFDIYESWYERQQYLYSIGAISQDTLDKDKSEYATAKAAYEVLVNQSQDGGVPASVLSKQYTAEKNANATELLRKQREDMILRAPRDGVISYRNVEVGSYLAAGTTVMTLVDNSHVYVDCSLSENDAAILNAGMEVKVTIDALGKTYNGKLVFVSPAMGTSEKTYTARISLDLSKGQVKAGLFARSSVDIVQKTDAICVPKEAVVTKNGKTSVFIVDMDNMTVEERPVTIGLLNDTQAEVISGINDGDVVVTTNQDKIATGVKVNIKSDVGPKQGKKAKGDA